MACETNGIKVGGIIEQLCDEGFDGITGAVITLLNEAMKLDRTSYPDKIVPRFALTH